MRTIDGGDGGGQVLRSALSLAAVRGEPVRVERVRGDRPDPGLKHQHLAGLQAIAAVCDATVEGDELGSETVVFDPGEPEPGEHTVEVGTAGAVTLVFETLLPLSAALDGPMSVTATGGTDVAWSPTLDYYERVRLPLARRAGLHAAVEPLRRGFYPEGGGEATLRVAPGEPRALSLTDRGALEGVRVLSVATDDLADADVDERQATAATAAVRAAVDAPVRERAVTSVDAPSTGSSVLVVLDYEQSVAGFTALGEPGRPAEDVGEAAAADALDFHDGPGVVDSHTGDQLVLPLAVGGGRVRLPAATDHVETNVAVAQGFGYDVSLGEREDEARLSG
ncbi:RNA 3'-terminal phosphate cyclase [Haloarchaeobius iranensis]|uniref:RNA 3'-terminal phosphate cyclase n=1 Tax=Haloarchaeobius iranensis TaxID=996166 RepID=A0A1G9XPH4_9EURY|nr:RNA 3'-terminal phosphate cyclase [Haloarchaeobius iranensis]SDM98326.1 RNA 3'-terminal phosphate cyclase (ATP) [Haloarchaeobius iranensis]